MAKKKVAAQSQQRQKDSNDNNTHHPQQHEAETMKHKQDPSEKIQSLKSLNSLLLKETFERRQQVESLEQAKLALEAEVTRFGTDKRGLETELSLLNRQNVALEMEKDVFFVFLETRLGEVFSQVETLKGYWDGEILGFREKVGELSASLENERDIRSQVTRERDSLKSDCGFWMAKENLLRENLNEVQTEMKDLEEKLDVLTMENDKLREEKRERDETLELVIEEGKSALNDYRAAAEEISVLKRRIDGLERQNKDIHMEKSEGEVKIKELEKELALLKQDVKRLGKEEKKLQDMVLESGKRSLEASEKEKEMSRHIESLVEAGKEKEACIKMVKAEKESLERLLDLSRKELEEKEQMMEGMIREKNEIQEANYMNQNEIEKLQKAINELRNELSALQISFGNETEKNRDLVSEVDEHKEALQRVSLERDGVLKGLAEERQSGVSLRKEKDLVEGKLLDAMKMITKLKYEIEMASAKSNRALVFLREMASSMLNHEEKQQITTAEADVEPYGKELDTIKSAFQLKTSMVEELMLQIDHMQGSIDKEKKSRKLWTLVSSATTLVAAVLAAYLAHAR